MRILRYLLKKEFRQIFRNRTLLPMILVVPLVQLLILPLAADYEVDNINISIVDLDRSTTSRELVSKITASGYFKPVGHGSSQREAFVHIQEGRADLILEIPHSFESQWVREGHQQLYIAVNAINGMKATLGAAYLQNIITNFNSDFVIRWTSPERIPSRPLISVTSSYWYNTHLEYRLFMVPGILAVLVTMICTYMCALNIVREKEMGTIEQINVTPIKKQQFILGKLIPFWIIGMLIFSLGLFLIAGPIYGLAPVGNLALLYAYLGLYLIAVLGLGLLISTFSSTQQQAMSVAYFFIMIFMLMGGLFTPIESMPEWAQVLTKANPVTYFIEVVRLLVLKGSGFEDIKYHFAIMVGFTVLLNSWAVFNYRKIV